MIPLPDQHINLVEAALRAAQAAGDLPELDNLPDIIISRPKKLNQGDYACPVAMALAKPTRMKPLDIAQKVAKHLPPADFVAKAEVAPPGFINFWLSTDWLRRQIDAIIDAEADFGNVTLGQGQKAQVEYLSANPTGPITIGRTRGAVLGEGIARILEAAGYGVTREYYFNNAGAQMRNLGESLRRRYLEALGEAVEIPGEEDPDAAWFYRGDYLIDYAKSLVDEVGEDWRDRGVEAFQAYAEKNIFDWIKRTLGRVGIYHDVFFNENSLYESGAVDEVLQRLQDAGFIYTAAVRENESDEVKEQNQHLKPAKWFRSTRLGDDEDRVVVKSSGEPTYTLPDIAYHADKIDRGYDLLVNVLGTDHKKQADVVRYGLEALGYRTEHLNVVFMQMMRMVRGGEEVKISTRRGQFITLDELIDEVGADAVQYFLMQRSPDSQLTFDVDLAVKQSNENPVYYIQYAHVRCAGIFREAQARGVSDTDADLNLLDDEALDFIRKSLELPEMVTHAARNLSPHTIAHFALELANQFHPMYDRVRVFGEGIPADLAQARLRFYRAAQVVFARVLALMGMSAPDRM